MNVIKKMSRVKDAYIYQRENRYFAQFPEEVRKLGEEELISLGAKNTKIVGLGVSFEADLDTLYGIVYRTRLSSRILAPLVRFRCPTADDLYEKSKKIRWTDFMSEYDTFAIFANVSKNDEIRHSKFASYKLKDAICDRFRDETGGIRPDVNPDSPDVWFNLHIYEELATVSLDLGCGSLHRRGYRKETVEAPMQETVAAAIIKMSGWDGTKKLYDPMCGSGTLLSEALMKYSDIPSAYLKKQFGFEYLPDFEKNNWYEIKKHYQDAIKPLPFALIEGSDVLRKAVHATKTNLELLPGGDKVKVNILDIRKTGCIENSVIVCNPPYGIRLGEEKDMPAFYKSFGEILKERCRGCEAYIYFGEPKYIRDFGVKGEWSAILKNGGLEGRLVKFRL
ncbi:THUMP domain-containing class I SAM-dependent RNA methyltransferase [Desulforegula conservatrix]|uniref:THUMP domain-containing class I SAM-dependent RNA methyltransferase n=1 Tax=Desulforegula conservatrix TaxID=153026 RepID=UPI0003F91AED|nr:THUMP domain-containing protein [Desulforegula conservatrix]